MRFLLLFILLINFCFAQVGGIYELKKELEGATESQISLKLKKGLNHVFKFGMNPDLPSDGLSHPVWQGNGTYVWPTSASVLNVSSTSADDTALGTGARTVNISGLDVNGLEIEETVSLNGITPVNTTKQFYRVNRAKVLTVGTVDGNAAGTISIKQSSNILAVIVTPYNQTLQSIYTVPSNKYVMIDSIHATTFKKAGVAVQTKESEFCLRVRKPGEAFQSKFLTGMRSDGSQTGWVLHAPLVFGPMSDIVACARTVTTDTAIAVSFSMLLVDKDWLIESLKANGYTQGQIEGTNFFN